MLNYPAVQIGDLFLVFSDSHFPRRGSHTYCSSPHFGSTPGRVSIKKQQKNSSNNKKKHTKLTSNITCVFVPNEIVSSLRQPYSRLSVPLFTAADHLSCVWEEKWAE